MRLAILASSLVTSLVAVPLSNVALAQDATFSWSTSNVIPETDPEGGAQSGPAFRPGTDILRSFTASGTPEILVPGPLIFFPPSIPGQPPPPPLPGPPEPYSFSATSTSNIQIRADPYVSVTGNVSVSAPPLPSAATPQFALNTSQAALYYSVIIRVTGELPSDVTSVPVIVGVSVGATLSGDAASSSFSQASSTVDITMDSQSLWTRTADAMTSPSRTQQFSDTVLFNFDLSSEVFVDMETTAQ